MTQHDPLYVQCRFEQADAAAGRRVTVAWILRDAAKVGRLMTLKGEDGWWRVLTVGDHPMPLSHVHERERQNHKGLPSL